MQLIIEDKIKYRLGKRVKKSPALFKSGTFKLLEVYLRFIGRLNCMSISTLPFLLMRQISWMSFESVFPFRSVRTSPPQTQTQSSFISVLRVGRMASTLLFMEVRVL